jgi:dihydrofolate synthase/folylpolyglutamate synthase
MTQYSDVLKKLYSINLFGMKLGLANSQKLSEALGHPENSWKSIHIAGTNGKGSVSKKIATALELSGKRVGLFTSPHISCFRERIRINGEMIPEEAVAKILSQIFAVIESQTIPTTFFEITTLLAFQYFAQEKVDFAVIETGLGGRYDSTNIITPILSVITSINLEHTEILGNTIEKIAYEKAGIIKSGVPVVIGPRSPHEYYNTYCLKQNSPCIFVSGQFNNFENENRAIAEKVLKFLKLPLPAIYNGLIANMPCRLEVIKKENQPTIILDVAHNPDGLQHLFTAIRERWPLDNIRVICGLSKTKDLQKCLKIISENAKQIHLVEAPNGRGAPIADLKHIIQENNKNVIVYENQNIAETVNMAIKEAMKADEIIVICGTFFIMSEARAALSITEPKDAIDMNEK